MSTAAWPRRRVYVFLAEGGRPNGLTPTFATLALLLLGVFLCLLGALLTGTRLADSEFRALSGWAFPLSSSSSTAYVED